MKSFARWLFGLRDDLDLDQRWWHRLLKVVFVLGACVVIAFGALMVSRTEPETTMDNVRVLTDLGRFSKTSDEKSNAILAFLKAPGTLGRLGSESERIDYISSYTLEKGWCAPYQFGYVDEQTNKPLKEQKSGYSYTLRPIPTDTSDKESNDEHANCWLATDLDVAHTSDVIKYEFTEEAARRAKLTAGAQWLGGILVAWLILGNLYYRGLVFIICGPRPKGQAVHSQTA